MAHGNPVEPILHQVIDGIGAGVRQPFARDVCLGDKQVGGLGLLEPVPSGDGGRQLSQAHAER